MYEFTIVQALVDKILDDLRAEKVTQVTEIRLRHGVALLESKVRQAFELAVMGTPLWQATLTLESNPLFFQCMCGHSQEIRAHELSGHLFACPSCGAIREFPETGHLELVSVKVGHGEPNAP